MNNRTVNIPGMSCEHCVRTIETELSELEGVQSAKADLTDKSLSISWDAPLEWDDIVTLLNEINYPPAE